MKKSLYGERDYAFGQRMLTLRTSIGLTQAGLGERLRVSRRAVAEWEAGSSYPKAQHLQQFIALAVRAAAFAAGREAEEIRGLQNIQPRGKLGAGKSSMHGRNRPRYRCRKSGQREPVCYGKSFRPLMVSRLHKTMNTLAITCLHEPVHAASQCVSSFPMFDLLNGPQVLYFYYAKGTDLACMLHSSGAPFHAVVLR